MTLDTYKRATELLERKEKLEEELNSLGDIKDNLEKYMAIRNELFMLGQEFAML